jgi:hypothetical protein
LRGKGAAGAGAQRGGMTEKARAIGASQARRGMVEQSKRARLGEDKARRRPPGAGQRLGALVRIFLAAVMPQGRAGARGTLPGDHGAADAWPRGPRHIAERWGAWPRHLEEGWRHMEDMGSPRLNQLGTRA